MYPFPTESTTQYNALLASKNLWPVDPMVEQNWSGRGQHAVFRWNERGTVDLKLQVQETLGSSSSAIVQSVRCKRILLARKTIQCMPGRSMTRKRAIEEVAHLNRLEHAHIVRVIGTYVIGKELSMLLYPVAQHNLDDFLNKVAQESLELGPCDYIASSKTQENLMGFFNCLAGTVKYIHGHLIKHMDIKPQNILVRELYTPGGFPDSLSFEEFRFKVYLADFGISRSYNTYEATETEGPTMFTRKYAAPEVVDQDIRGLSADIFSLGCVFAEMIATLMGSSDSVESFRAALHRLLQENKNGDGSYQANIDRVHLFMDALSTKPFHPFPLLHSFKPYMDVVKQMLEKDPLKRPSAADLVATWGSRSCCRHGPDKLEAAREESASNTA